MAAAAKERAEVAFLPDSLASGGLAPGAFAHDIPARTFEKSGGSQ